MPDFAQESAAVDEGFSIIAGVDEVGRGPWAGPVVAAAVILDPATLPADLRTGLNDSKKVPTKRRLDLLDALMAVAKIGIGEASVEEIDTLNVLGASMLAMRRAVEDLPLSPDLVLVDGNRVPDGLSCPCRAIVGGDGLSLSIAAASIVAKVTRDRLMAALSLDCPGYGWERNAGYGTKQHQEGLARLGVTAHHRRSFAPIAKILGQDTQDSPNVA